MTLKIGRGTSITLRILLYVSCFAVGVYGFSVQDSSWAAQEGTAEYARYLMWFQLMWVDIWSTLATAVLALICWAGNRATDELSPRWNLALLICRRSFACFGFMLLGFVMIALPPPVSPGIGGLLLFLGCLGLLSRRD